MANVIGIMGESGSGKTTAARTLNPKETYYIDCDKKGLSWKGWKKCYSEVSRNYYKTSDAEFIMKVISGISDKKPEIKNIIIDTLNGIMVDDEMARMKDKGYDKWQDMAIAVYSLIQIAQSLRDDLTVFFMCHVQDDHDDTGSHHYHILTNGRKLDKIKLESKLTTVLFAKCLDGKYIFETQSKNSTAKSPMELFSTFEIPNDLQFIINSFNQYEKE